MSDEQTTQLPKSVVAKKKRPHDVLHAPSPLKAGEKLTAEQRDQIKREIRSGMDQLMTACAIRRAIKLRHGLNPITIRRMIKSVEDEDLRDDVLNAAQVRSASQKRLAKIIVDPTSKPADVLNAIKVMVEHFGLTTKSTDSTQAEQLVFDEAVERMKKMTVQELAEAEQIIMQGGEQLSKEHLLFTSEDLELVRKRKRKAKASANDRDA